MFKRLRTAGMMVQPEATVRPTNLGAVTLNFGEYEGRCLDEIGARPFGLDYLYSLWLQGNRSPAQTYTRRAIRDFLAGR